MSPGTDLHVVDTGPEDGLPLVFIHGFPFHQAMWEPQRAALEERYRVVSYDVRGLGASPVGDGQYTMESFVDDLVGVLDARGLGEVVGCGLSMGGYILFRALEREPTRFKGAVLCDTRSDADDDEGRLARADAIRSLKARGHAPFVERFLPRVLSPTTRRTRPEVVETVQAMVEGQSILGMCGCLLAMAARTDTTPSLDRIKVPTLLVVGEDDAITPPSVSRRMAGRIPGARIEVIPDAGHLTNLEAPDAVNRALEEFLAAPGGPA